MTKKWEQWLQITLILVVSFIFIQSLWFKFGNSKETIYIFQQVLDPWAYQLTGFHLFNKTGIFSQYMIGTAELIASLLMLASLIPSLFWLRALGGLGASSVTAGAILFHLGPLGIAVKNADGSSDKGVLFILAVLSFLIGNYLFIRNQKLLFKNLFLILRQLKLLK